jgi:hypothetical protein
MPETTHNPGGNGAASAGEGDHRSIGARVEQIGQDAQQLWTDAQGAVHQITETLDLRGRVERNPYGMMLAAMGVGYVLGGGLFTSLTARILRFGLRVAALPFVKDELKSMAQAAAGAPPPSQPPPEAK